MGMFSQSLTFCGNRPIHPAICARRLCVPWPGPGRLTPRSISMQALWQSSRPCCLWTCFNDKFYPGSQSRELDPYPRPSLEG